MGRILTGVVVAAIIGGLIGWVYYLRSSDGPPAPAQVPLEAPLPVAPSVVDAPPERPPVFVPVPEEAARDAPDPIPPLDDSDASVLDALRARMAAAALEQALVHDGVVRKIVVTVDNLVRENVSMKVRALRAAPGRFLVTGSDDNVQLDPANYARYRTFVGLLNTLEPADAADLYVRYYPLLQEAYEELGYPERQFHTRAIDVIDELLETPDARGPLRLIRPHVLYEFADPDLEALSAGQKMLLRAGADNAARVKQWLRTLRSEIEARQID